MIRLRDHPGMGFGAVLIGMLIGSTLVRCTAVQEQTALATPAGALFCRIHQAGGGEVTVALADASVMASNPSAAPLVIIATGATKLYVDGACAAAAKPGEIAVPVPPPAGPAVVPIVAVTPPSPAPAAPR
jgi:hypothetical protein